MRSRHRRVSLCETLDRVLNKGAVVTGDIIISVADVPLVYIGVNLVVASVETMREWSQSSQARNTREAVSPALSEVEEPASRVMEA
ncbi:MAG: gas vesicle protein [Deltaproteobacteria bacterium]|nr:gas vesicle protein [Deltaproteobacteria bacterium]